MGGCITETSTRKLKTKLQIGQYKIIKQQTITNGAYGDIWKCKTPGGQIYALKEIKFQTSELKSMFEKEVKILNQLKGVEGILEIFGSIVVKEQENNYQTGYILLEFCQMTLFNELTNLKFSEKMIAQILYKLIKPISKIHEKGFIHLDLKPENILIKNGQYKICDFGSALQEQVQIKYLSKREKSALLQYIEGSSTLIYRPPELINFSEKIDGKTDIWMLGCIGYFLLYRRHPFEKNGKLAIVTGTVEYEADSALVNCLKGMLCVEMDKRWSEEKVEVGLRQILQENK